MSDLRAAMNRYVMIWFAICISLLVACAGMTLAYLTAIHGRDTANCTNNVLGTRNALTDADHANEARKISDQAVAVSHEAQGIQLILSGKTPAERLSAFRLYQQGVDEFKKSLTDWKARDKQINEQRAQHPLGRC